MPKTTPITKAPPEWTETDEPDGIYLLKVWKLVQEGSPESVRLWLENPTRRGFPQELRLDEIETYVNAAAIKGRADNIEEILKTIKGPIPPKTLEPAFMSATAARHSECAKRLLDLGVDADLWESHPLRTAANRGHNDTVRILLDHGAKMDPVAIIKAYEAGNMDLVKLMLGHCTSKWLKEYSRWFDTAGAHPLRSELERRGRAEVTRIKGQTTEMEP